MKKLIKKLLLKWLLSIANDNEKTKIRPLYDDVVGDGTRPGKGHP